MLSAAFPTYPVDESTSELYLHVLTEQVFDGAVGFAVVADWIETRLTFPKVAELLEECLAEARRRSAQAKALQQSGGGLVDTNCKRCSGERMIETIDEHGRIFTSPCPDCDSERYNYWVEGHLRSDHDVVACVHPWCIAKTKRQRPARR